MEYLEAQQIVHRDLRSENILLTDSQCCKIADFGLAQAYAGRQHGSSGEKVPVKWMAPEIFLGEKYTPKSDVWSFGVLVTEMITYGEEPYSGRDKACCISAVCRGYRMPRPSSCPVGLYDIILQCWRDTALERPAFIELQERLTSLMTKPSTETTLLLDPSTETTLLPKPSTEATLLLDPSTETTLLPKPSTETTLLLDPSTETTLLPKPSTEATLLLDPSTETTLLPKPSTETTLLFDPSTEATLLPDPSTEATLLPDPSTEKKKKA
ncbi:hypothetical protein AAFF_G00431340 [Aldrovandia affinis]|uniref:Protein kinase domain-containing protein n=1 Tax=Aldrovandia affinis TaxID=143900 RepID=A0AAD7S8N6_9TELE|nr:hypothetical protein AAFF_G00431340 [Aldrovandia affinis]